MSAAELIGLIVSLLVVRATWLYALLRGERL